MTEFERFAEALAKTESGDLELAWGDPKEHKGTSPIVTGGHGSFALGRNFMAMGRWQCHAAWYHDWLDPDLPVGASWDEAFRRALERFWNYFKALGDQVIKIAMSFHLGVEAVKEGRWDADYGQRFQGFYYPKTEES